jgi:hypothetical protein
MTLSIRSWAMANWFWLAMPMLVTIEWAVLRSVPLDEAWPVEAMALFDLCVFVPALYALCYARHLSAGALAVRLLGLVCLGVLLAGWMVPAERQLLLPSLGWLRIAGIVVLSAIELVAVVALTKLVFSGASDADALAARTGAPAWLVRLMMLEARFWRWLWRTLRGR